MPHKQHVLDEYWSARADAYHEYHVSANRAEADRILWSAVFARFLESLEGPHPLRILDVGTGPGYVAGLLKGLGHSVIGLDAAPGMIERAATAHPEVEFAVADVTDVPSTYRGFDAVTCRYLMWTLRTPHAAARSWFDALRPGGRLIAADANWYTEGIPQDLTVQSKAGPNSFVETYDEELLAELPLSQAASPEEYAAVFREAGFAEVEIHWLPEVEELDAKYGLGEGHESKPNFVVTGVRPAE